MPSVREGSPEMHSPGCGDLVAKASDIADQLAQADLQIIDDTQSTTAEADREIAFDKLRIEHFTALRMGAIRARSWWLIATCMSTLVVLDMIGRPIIEITVDHSWGILPSIRMVVAVAVLFFAKHAYRRAAQFKIEIGKSALPEPSTPPEFSTLENGSDRWKQLENVR